VLKAAIFSDGQSLSEDKVKWRTKFRREQGEDENKVKTRAMLRREQGGRR